MVWAQIRRLSGQGDLEKATRPHRGHVTLARDLAIRGLGPRIRVNQREVGDALRLLSKHLKRNDAAH